MKTIPMPYKAPLMFMLLTISLGISIVDADECTRSGGSQIAYTIVVDKSGGGNFTSVKSAIDSIPSNNDRWIKVHINPGVYVEKVTIPKDKPCVVLEGQGRSVTTNSFNERDQTDKSATFTSVADNLVASGITFKLIKRALSYGQVPGVLPPVAARILGDKSAFFECDFLVLQDTLWDALGRHYFSKCYIEGGADFIFGMGQPFYEDCSINVTAGEFSSALRYGYITAQGRKSPEDPSSYVFKGGVIFGTLRAYLGRVWGPYARVIFQDTMINANVIPQGATSCQDIEVVKSAELSQPFKRPRGSQEPERAPTGQFSRPAQNASRGESRTSQRRRPLFTVPVASAGGSWIAPSQPICSIFSRRHSGVCKFGPRGCYRCGSLDHFLRDYSKAQDVAPVLIQQSAPPIQRGRWFQKGGSSSSQTGRGVVQARTSGEPRVTTCQCDQS
ncbi:putative Pectinesterase-2 [Hibiscus syriacus]|uniref:pectinesterase n=1 Tax=Hibiscus syriacus TaxID=106335 RepID=A0A6A3AEY3_HIBSY|nr:putative Pectinesterase-2 [Hibiscus syriacus]